MANPVCAVNEVTVDRASKKSKGTQPSVASQGSSLSNRSFKSYLSQASKSVLSFNPYFANPNKAAKCQYKGQACAKEAYNRQLCREHFCDYVRMRLK